MSERIFSPEEIDEMREASKGIGMAGAAIVPFVRPLLGPERFEAGSRKVQPFICGGTTLVGKAQ